MYNGFVCNVNSPITLHFVRSRWHLLHAFQFAFNSGPKVFLGRPKSEFVGHPEIRDANIVFLKILIVWVNFGSKLLSSISKSEIYSFLKYLYATERHRQAGDVENTPFRFGSLWRDPFFDPSQILFGSRPILWEPLAYNVNSAIKFFMQSPRSAIIGTFWSYLAC